MSRRRRRKGVSVSGFDQRYSELSHPYTIVTVPVWLPRPVAHRAGREIYTYVPPRQIRRKRRVIRYALLRPRAQMVKVGVRLRVPKKLPLARNSYVSLSRNRLNIHSIRQHQRAMDHGELNRTRREERKSGRRKARNGQLDSARALSFGSVAEAYRRGESVGRIADAAAVARAIYFRR